MSDIKQALREGLITVNFTKVNGAKRNMVATLKTELLPKKEQFVETPRDENLLVVWDMEQHGWRSIKVDSIIEWAPGEHSIKPIAEPVGAGATLGWTPNK